MKEAPASQYAANMIQIYAEPLRLEVIEKVEKVIHEQLQAVTKIHMSLAD